ncbi:PTS sugar transporter subunit IIB [Pectinatus frisingensis]|uniref:PTS sugar transporter subunit IIB n=1 Tax=Pectinatus frisingensis TaxID=865 RepID=UPI0018C72DBA|nr:PTS sugar transporter subunit IIB [Pectinatus frisingensis]
MKKIVLLCASGMSTSMLVKKMQTAAQKMAYICEIAAYPTSEAKTKASDADLILLGPQVRFSMEKIKAQCPGVQVAAIDMRLYGKMDGKAVIEFAKQKLGD